MRFALAIFVLLALPGCASQQEIQARQAAAQAAFNDQDDSQCRSYGVAPGTQPYFECRMTLAQMRNQNEAAREAHRQAASQQMIVTGASMMTGR